MEDLSMAPAVPLQDTTLALKYNKKKMSKNKGLSMRYSAEMLDLVKTQSLREARSESVTAFLKPRETMSSKESARRQKMREEERKCKEEAQ